MVACRTRILLLTAVCFFGASEAYSQFPPPGGPFPGGGPPMGGNFSPRGGPMMGGQRFSGHRDSRRGDRGRDRSSRFVQFLRRMDTNGDGVLREDEIPEERRGMFRMMSMRFGMDPSKGIVLDKLKETMANLQGRRNNGRPSGPGNNQAKPKQPEAEPLVPGFGTDREVQPALAFGVRPPSANVSTQQPSQARRRRGGFSQGHENRDEQDDQETNSSPQDRSASYRFRTAHERLPEGLPDWFISRDSDMDGQVAMAEYSRSWTRSTVADYYRYDVNRDGMITPEECLHPVGENANEIDTKKSPVLAPAGPSSSQPAKSEPEVPWWQR